MIIAFNQEMDAWEPVKPKRMSKNPGLPLKILNNKGNLFDIRKR